METPLSPAFWWLKSSKFVHELAPTTDHNTEAITSTPKITEDPSTISSSLREFLERERSLQSPSDADADIGSIIDEINKLAAESPLGPYEMKDFGDRSVEEIMKEAEKIYLESSKSFEQLSARSRTSANLSVSFNDSPKSTPTPKSASPLPLDSEKVLMPQTVPVDENEVGDYDSYSEDFVQGDDGTEMDSPGELVPPLVFDDAVLGGAPADLSLSDLKASGDELKVFDNGDNLSMGGEIQVSNGVQIVDEINESVQPAGGIDNIIANRQSNEVIRKLEEENKNLLDNLSVLKVRLEETTESLTKTRANLYTESLKSPEINLELEKAFEELKDTKETNTVLQLQLDGLNKSHQHLKATYDDLLASSKSLEMRLINAESALTGYKAELTNVQEHRDKLLESETNFAKLLEVEKIQTKAMRAQNDKDARCIQDLNRQVKEMERIMSRKHPDSVSALIVAAKGDPTDNNLTARKLLEDRIKNLEGEVVLRDQQSSKVFLEVQEKFSEMTNKYESHIEDLELHVNDLKNQLKHKRDTFDVYTQTFVDVRKIPAKETVDAGVQTRMVAPKVQPVKKVDKGADGKEDAHLLATIRGLQADLVNKEKVALKLQKELDEAKKTNRRLQKEREGSLKNIAERRGDFRSYPERLSAQLKTSGDVKESGEDVDVVEELKAIKTERDKMRLQLCRIEEDYQNLKAKRLYDLSALQQAHEEEISTYVTNIGPLREQLQVQQLTINTLHEQLRVTKAELEALTAERDDLYNRLRCHHHQANSNGNEDEDVSVLEQRYQDRERRLRAIVHGLAQKNVDNTSCQQCAARQQQLIVYKNELDQLLATLRTLT